MTVTAYLDHVARLKGVPRRERRREVVEAIEACWLNENARRHIRKLSKGNRQRVGLAQALIGAPPILILDEPTSGLDPTQVANFRDLVARLARKHSVLLSTHILSEVEATCSRVVVIDRGRAIVAEGIDELRRRAHRRTRLRVRVRDGGIEAQRAALEQSGWAAKLTVEGDALALDAPTERRAEVVALAERHGGLRELVEERTSLEDVFRDLVAPAAPTAPVTSAAP
jgi:ABC-2 type transport system ATP-binding protein